MMYTQAGGPCTNYDCSLRNNAGYCKVTVCMNPKYNGLANKEQATGNSRNVSLDEIKEAVAQYRKQRMTNYDHVISMTPEELAHFMARVCPPGGKCNEDGNCFACRLEWLKSPVLEVQDD